MNPHFFTKYETPKETLTTYPCRFRSKNIWISFSRKAFHFQDMPLNLYRKLTGPTRKSVSQASTQSPPLSPTKVRRKVPSPPLCESFYFKIGL